MRLCLTCYSLWPREAAFCGKCRRPLGTKRCPKGHANSLFSPATTCLVCNEGPLDGVPCLPLDWVITGLTLLLLFGLWRWGWEHAGAIIATFWKVTLWTLGILCNTTPGHVSRMLRQTLAWYVTLWLLSYLLPQAAGRSTRQGLRKVPWQVWGALRSLLRLGQCLFRRDADKAKALPLHHKHIDNGSD